MSNKKYTVPFSIDVNKFDREKVLEDAREQGCCIEPINEDDIIFINEEEKEEFDKMIYALQCLGYSTRHKE